MLRSETIQPTTQNDDGTFTISSAEIKLSEQAISKTPESTPMQLNEATDYIKSYLAKEYSQYTKEGQCLKKISEALDIINENKLLKNGFSQKDLKALCDIEMIDPSYFPGLSIAAANTIVQLYKANSALSMPKLLEITDKLANRSRPWESLSAFSRIAKSCPKQINQEMLTFLSGVNSNVLEICGHEIENETKKANSGVIGALKRLRAKEVDIRGIIQKNSLQAGKRLI